jgi:hypothetical protein
MLDMIRPPPVMSIVGTDTMLKSMTIWTVLSLAVLALLTAVHYPLYMSTGASTSDQHGWPGGWLTREEYQTWVDSRDGRGLHVDVHKVHWYISSVGSMTTALVVAAEVPGTVMLPVLIMSRKKARCQQGAAPNGGPAIRLGNSGVAEGPPSVS